MPGLANSRWATTSIPPLTSWPRPAPSAPSAPSPSIPPPSQKTSSGVDRPAQLHNDQGSGSSQQPSPQQELSRFLKIVARLNWKLPYLNLGYETATARNGRSTQDNEANEIHFKLDFHEFYMLLERALVHLMGVYGIVIHRHHVSRQAPLNGSSASQSDDKTGKSTAAGRRTADGGIGSGPTIRDPITGSINPVSAQNQQKPQNQQQQQQHRYHANVLAALDNPDNPLNPCLGQGEVRRQLSHAKELRNRWKNADDGGAVAATATGSSNLTPLESYNLEQMLQTIFAAFDQAFLMAEAYVKEVIITTKAAPFDWSEDYDDDPSSSAFGASPADWSTNGDDWGFMMDAMDWEAV